MKTVKKQGLTASQKQYLRRHIVWYYLYVVSLRTPKKSGLFHKSPPETVEKSASKAKSPQVAEIKFHLKLRLPRILQSKPVKFAGVFILLLGLVVVFQVFYPKDRSLPLSRLQSAGYQGFADKNEILKNFEDFDSRVVTVHTHTKSITTSYKDLGITIKPTETVDEMTEYPLTERLVPFSILVKGNREYSVSRDLDERQLELFVENVIAQAGKQPVDAVVRLNGTQLQITDSEEGYEYQAAALRSRVLKADLADRGQIVFTPTILDPAISTDTAKNVIARMQQRIDSPLLINAEGASRRIEAATIASWLDIAHKPKEKTIEIVFNKQRVAESLRPLATEVDKDPIPTIVTYLNGRQAGRVEGFVGKKVEFDELVERVAANTSPLTGTIEAIVKTLPPPDVIDRKYSKDNQGLQTLLSYWTSVNPGQYSIDVRSLNGSVAASLNPHKLMPSVGLYRSYVASLMYGRISVGSTTLSTVTQTGQSVEVCLDLMLREANEGCTAALGSIVGWGASDSLLRAQGFDNTTLTEGAGLTTADDTSQWFVKLLGNELTLDWQKNNLLDTMSRSVYRSGIPAGTVGLFTANSYGNYGRITNDMAVVYNPSGTYIVSILSEGSSPERIADLSTEINKVMSQ